MLIDVKEINGQKRYILLFEDKKVTLSRKQFYSLVVAIRRKSHVPLSGI